MEVASESITVECQVCGQPLTLEWRPTGNRVFDESMLRVAKGTVHSHCWHKRKHELTKAEENMRIAQRSADFRLLCPPQYHNSSEWIKTPEARRLNHKAVTEALAWTYGFMGLTLHGKVSGSGKTTTAWLLCEREFNSGKFIVAMTHKEMSDKATWMAKELTPESKRWAETLKSCDLLFVDDLGKSRFKTVSGEGRASEEFLFDIVDTRIKNQLPTIFTVNMTGAEMKAAMSDDKGAYLIRRLREFFVNVKFDRDEK